MRLLSYFWPKAPIYLVYMLQQVEYDPRKFFDWAARFPDLRRVMRRKRLVMTRKTKLLVAYTYVLAIVYVLVNIQISLAYSMWELLYVLLLPVWLIFMLYVSVLVAWSLLEKPRRDKQIKAAEKTFAAHPATKIAIAGSYGKTTVKELLTIILSQGKKVAATPGNKNVPISHARWAATLDGDEDVLIIEYGEGAPGDIARFAEITHPDIGIITGVAPNHLDGYKTLQAVKDDLYSLANYVPQGQLYLFSDYNVRPVIEPKISITGMEFGVKLGGKVVEFKTALVGRHLLGSLSLCIKLADKLGLSVEQIKAGVAATTPFEHRMQPRAMHGAWIIDDTYNGSLEGFRAGLELLAELPAERKIYVTPGLVDQGEETQRVHKEIGQLIAKARPDKVVLMQNSVTDFIKVSLAKTDFDRELVIEPNPLEFYTNLDQVIAAGDLILMQNDWTDNYF